MKLVTMLLVLSLGSSLMFAFPARAQDSTLQPADDTKPVKVQIVEGEIPAFNNRISFGPVGLLLGIGSFSYERAMGERLALEIAPWGIYFGFGDEKVYGAALGLGASFYLTGRAPRGFRVNLNVAPGFVGASGETSVFMLGAKFLFGYNWVWESGFSIGLHAGAQYLRFSSKDIKSSLDGILPSLDFNLGFCF